MCATNFDSYGKDLKLLGVQWMQEFQKYPDDLMETAVRSCITFGEKFPTIKNIRNAMRDLQYDEETKPKQIPWEVPRSDSLAQKIQDMALGKTDTKSYLQALDISKQVAYAKDFFPDISHDLVLRNLPEFMQGMEHVEMCLACRSMKQACPGYRPIHCLDKNGWIKNEWQKCDKTERR